MIIVHIIFLEFICVMNYMHLYIASYLILIYEHYIFSSFLGQTFHKRGNYLLLLCLSFVILLPISFTECTKDDHFFPSSDYCHLSFAFEANIQFSKLWLKLFHCFAVLLAATYSSKTHH